MPNRLSRSKKSADDPNLAAFQTVNKFAESADTDEAKPTRSEISRIMSAMGRKGGKKSAKARMEKIPAEQRSEIAANAARVMWAKKKAQSSPS
jgi:hypothetical protein